LRVREIVGLDLSQNGVELILCSALALEFTRIILWALTRHAV
jgi:hypothetical protein